MAANQCGQDTLLKFKVRMENGNGEERCTEATSSQPSIKGHREEASGSENIECMVVW